MTAESFEDRRWRAVWHGIRLMGVQTRGAAAGAARAHGAYAVAAAAMGRLLSAAALVGSDLKETGSYLRLTAEGGGPLGRVRAEAHADGLLRARVDHPGIQLPPTAPGKLPVGAAVGSDGSLVAERVAADGRVYTSASELVSGELGEDVAQFLWSSEQVRSAVALGVLVERDGSVAASGGLLIQALPGADPEELLRLSERVEALTDLSWRLVAGEHVTDLLAWVVDKPVAGWAVDALRFGCLCSPEQSRQLLAVAAPAERRAWAQEDGAEVVCHYCGTRYQFTADDVMP